MRRALSLAVAGLLLISHAMHAQGDSVIARVRGVAFDSLRGKPLADAFIALVGSDISATSDAQGRFALERVKPGVYQVTVHHGTLDTLGFSGLSSRVAIKDASAEVHVAIPSFATLWRKACGEKPIPADSGFVYGTVRDATTNRPIDNAKIEVTWYDSIPRLNAQANDLAARDRDALDASRRKVSIRSESAEFATAPPRNNTAAQNSGGTYELMRWSNLAATDETGAYAVCSIPVRASGIRIVANTQSLSSDSLEILLDPRVQRRDILVGPPSSEDAAHRGTIAGVLTDDAGNPFTYARVVTSGAREARSDETGRFVLRDVPVGTRRVEVRYIGMTPSRATVDVLAGDTALVAMTLSRVPLLPGMRARAVSLGRVLSAEFDVRRRAGLGYIVDSTTIMKHTAVVNVLRDVPSLNLVQRDANLIALVPDGRGGTCAPAVWLDGIEAAYGHLFDLKPNEISAIEVYTRPMTVPPAFVEKGGDRKCGVILVWTRYIFRNR